MYIRILHIVSRGNIRICRNPLQQHAGRCVVWVLRNQLALERALQNALAETGGASQVAFHLSFNLVHDWR